VKNLLLTGAPGSGKTTVILEALALLKVPRRGFTTEEIRDSGGERLGFRIRTLDGKSGLLAHTSEIKSGPRVGRYRVDLGAVERLCVPAVRGAGGRDELVVIDEIGKMECLSDLFCEAVREALSSRSLVLGTVAVKGSPFIKETRAREDGERVEVTRASRGALAEELARRLGRAAGGRDG